MNLHLPFGIALALGVVGMVLADGSATFETLAKVRGRSRLAGLMDALGDDAGLAVQVSAIGSIFLYGISWRAAIVLASINVASAVGTWFWTEEANAHVKAKAGPYGNLGRHVGRQIKARRPA